MADESPEDNVHCLPGKQRHHPRGAAPQQIKQAKKNGGDAAQARRHDCQSSKDSGSRATATKRSSKVSFPYSAGKVVGSPSSRILPCERNKTRPQTSETSYMLCEVHSTPTSFVAAKSRMRDRISLALAGSREAVGSSNSSRRGRF